MATILDFSILGQLSIIFVFLLVWLGGWGLMMMIDPFRFKDEGKKKVYSLLAFAIGFIVILSPPVLGMIVFSIPWMSFLLLGAFFMLFFARMFNPDDEQYTKKIMDSGTAKGFLYFFCGLILVFAFASAFGQGLLEEQPGVSDGDRIVGDTTPVDTFVPVNSGSGSGTVETEFGTVPSSGGSSVASDSIGTNIVLTLFHPKILGMLFMLILAGVTILMIAK